MAVLRCTATTSHSLATKPWGPPVVSGCEDGVSRIIDIDDNHHDNNTTNNKIVIDIIIMINNNNNYIIYIYI